jgi:hypothetical protein
MRRRTDYKTINPNIRHIILAIDILIIIGMFIYAQKYLKKSSSVIHMCDNIEYLLTTKLLSNNTDFLIELKMKNKGGESKLLRFEDPQYEFIIKRYGKAIWRSFGIKQKEVLLPPEGRIYFSEIWDQKNKFGEIVEPGEYQVIARVNLSPPVSIATLLRVKK